MMEESLVTKEALEFIFKALDERAALTEKLVEQWTEWSGIDGKKICEELELTISK